MNDFYQMHSPTKYCGTEYIKRYGASNPNIYYSNEIFYIYADPMPVCVKQCRDDYSPGKCFSYCFKSHILLFIGTHNLISYIKIDIKMNFSL